MRLFFISIIILLSYIQTNAQSIKDYKYLLKVNASDVLFMGRLTGEIEIPIFKNTSITSNLGFHYRDYFYDDEAKTSTASDFNFFHGITAQFPAPNALGLSVGLGIRQYINPKYNKPKRGYLEVKGYHRYSNYNGKYEIYWNNFLRNEEDQLVKGKQKLNMLYLAIGRNDYLFENKIGVDFSIGFTRNFVKLATCQNDCTNKPINVHPAFIYSSEDFLRGNFHPMNNFNKFRMEVKITFIRKSKELDFNQN